MNYAKGIPIGNNGAAMTNLPAPFKALATYSSENATASSVITMNDNTTAIELGANGSAAVMRWVASTDTTASVVSAASGANFDHFIPSGTYRRFVVPVESMPQTSIVGANKQNGLYNRYAYKTIGAASVLATEY